MRKIKYIIEDIGYFFYDLWEDKPEWYSIALGFGLFIYYISKCPL